MMRNEWEDENEYRRWENDIDDSDDEEDTMSRNERRDDDDDGARWRR